MRWTAYVCVFSLVGLLVAAPPAYAGSTTCTGVITGPHDNVVVPSGADCFLSNAQVKGNVQVMPGASLSIAGGFNTIGGNVHGIHSRFVVFTATLTRVGGNVHIHGGDAGTTSGVVPPADVGIGGNATIELNAGRTLVVRTRVDGQLHIFRNTDTVAIRSSFVVGHVRVEDNTIPATAVMNVEFNLVSGHLQVLRNSGDGAKQVVSNTVARKLQCFDNDPPFVGGPNPDAAETQGQCFKATP